MQEKLQDYVFYVISKEFDFLHSKGFNLGVKRIEDIYDHEKYIEILRNLYASDMGPVIFENIPNTNWSKQAEMIAENGNIMIANTAVEIKNIQNRLYGIYLPSYPSPYQIQELKSHLQELEKIPIDVGVYGYLSNDFLRKRIQLNNNFNSLLYLKNYLQQHTKRINNEELTRKLVTKVSLPTENK